MNVLIIEDNIRISDNIVYILEKENYNCQACYDGEEGYKHSLSGGFDLIILDIMLPLMDGFEILESLRANKIDTPVLVLSAKDQVDDKVKALNLGSDDYLTKPFAAAELLARIKSIVRRKYDIASNIIELDALKIDTTKREVFVKDNKVDLTQKEYDLLQFLAYNKNKVVSKISIAQYVWGESLDMFTMSNFIEVHISNIRKKIEGIGGRKYIHTKRGFGFILTEKGQDL